MNMTKKINIAIVFLISLLFNFGIAFATNKDIEKDSISPQAACEWIIIGSKKGKYIQNKYIYTIGSNLFDKYNSDSSIGINKPFINLRVMDSDSRTYGIIQFRNKPDTSISKPMIELLHLAFKSGSEVDICSLFTEGGKIVGITLRNQVSNN